MQPLLTMRHFNPTDEEYQACIRVSDVYWPENPPGSIEDWKFSDREARKDKLRQRFVIEWDGNIIGAGTYADPYWLEVKDKYHFGYLVLPQHDGLTFEGQSIHARVESFVLQELQGRTVQALLTSMREDKATRVTWLKENGYRPTMRYPNSTLQVADFDFAPFAGKVEKAEAKGFRFFHLDYLQAHDPDWHRKLYEAWVEIELDVPSPLPPRPVPMEEFDKMFRHPSFAADIWVIAVAQHEKAERARFGPYAGVTAVGPAQSQPDHWYIWLTGVCRAYRRQGIAMALKLTSIRQAQEREAKRFDTGNEENNPMFDLNLKLGFKSQPAWQDWEKSFL